MAKKTMGKDESGTFHPGKGKPSGVNKEEGLGIQATPPEHMDQYNEVTDKYTDGEELAPNVPVRHPNRNTSKGEDTFKAKENVPESDKTVNDALSADRSSTVPEELPGILTKEGLTELATYQSDCCISVFLGTHEAGVEVNENYDVISFKNVLQKLTAQLKERNINAAQIERMLEPGFELVRDQDFWKQTSPGLAVFIADGYFKYIKMPVGIQEDVVIESTFYVTPLIPILAKKEYFYLLVISKKQCKLFRADESGMEYIHVNDLPKSLQEDMGDTDVQTTFRRGTGGGDSQISVHGAGGGNNNDDKVYIANYFESVDDVLWKNVLHDQNAPLVLAGVEYLIPIYKSVCDYKHVWEQSLTGSHEHEDTATLYKQAKELMQPYFAQRLNRALENYGNQSATELTSSIIDDVVPATYYGRVSHLFVQRGEHIWGRFDEMENKLEMQTEETEGAEDLIDNAVVRTLMTGGDIFLLDKEQMPADSPIAAIFRY